MTVKHRSAHNVLAAIFAHPGGICTGHIARWMLTNNRSEGALSITKRITELRRGGYPIRGGLQNSMWCQEPEHHHRTNVGFYKVDGERCYWCRCVGQDMRPVPANPDPMAEIVPVCELCYAHQHNGVECHVQAVDYVISTETQGS